MTATATVRLDYFYGTEDKTGSFYRVPKAFEKIETYSTASLEVKYLYCLMLDRVSISARNGWLDAGRVFIYFSLKEVARIIRVGLTKATQIIHEMENLGLILRKKQGQGKPARIFVKNIIEEGVEKEETKPVPETMPETIPETSRKEETNVTETVESMPERTVSDNIPTVEDTPAVSTDAHIEVEKTLSSCTCPEYTPAEKTRETTPVDTAPAVTFSTYDETPAPVSGAVQTPPNSGYEYARTPSFRTGNTGYNCSGRTAGTSAERLQDMNLTRELIRDNIDYHILQEENANDMEQIDGYVELMVHACCSTRDTIRINGEDFPQVVVRSRFEKLNRMHLLYVLECMRNNTTQVRNIRAYTLSALYNSYTTIDAYYTLRVQHDMVE